MKLIALLPEVVELVFFRFSTAGLSLLSAYAETVAFASVQHGNLTFGLWAAYMGLVALAFAYLIGTDRIVPKARALN